MSDFYRLKRIVIKDVVAFVGFVAGFVGAAPFVWTHLTSDVDRGELITGLFHFLLAILAGGVAGGAIGLAVGTAIGALWERLHRRVRGSRAASPAPLSFIPTVIASERRELRAIIDVRYSSELPASEFAALLQRAWPGGYDVSSIDVAIRATLNVAAWDGARLIGAVRVLSDGRMFSTVADILVDSDYRGRGIGRALMTRALEVCPTATLFLGAEPRSAGFFEHIGCERRLIGFTLRRPSEARRSRTS